MKVKPRIEMSRRTTPGRSGAPMVPRERPRALPSPLISALALAALLLPSARGAFADPAPSTGPFTVSGTLQSPEFREVANNLGNVTSITSTGEAADGRLFLTVRSGRILIFNGTTVLPQPFLNIVSLIRSDGFEQGLLSVAFHPDYARNGFFFVDYTNVNGATVVQRFQRSAGDPNRADPASGKILLTIQQPFANHNGGQLQFGPDGYLYVAMGDGGDAFDPLCHAQREDSLLGKILRLDVDQNANTPPYYGIPASNPFRGAGNPRDEVWASGLRNPWRFSFDRVTGDLWIGDVGQNQREEIDFQPASSRGGENYGWKVMEGTVCQTANACPGGVLPCNDPSYTPPVLQYSHSEGCSVTGGYVYRGAALPQLRGNYFFADYCTGVIWLAAPQSGNPDVLDVRRLAKTLSTLTSFGEDSRGEIYAATLNGALYALAPNSAPSPADRAGLLDPAAARFHLRQPNGSDRIVGFGPRNSGWLPVAGDWNGDGTTTIGYYDPRTGIFRLKDSLAGGSADVVRRVGGQPANALPVTGDWNGDGKDTVGVYLPTEGVFKLTDSLTGQGLEIAFSGQAGGAMKPVAGDWNGDGQDTVGVYNQESRTFTLYDELDGGPADHVFAFGAANGLLPVAGDWNGDGRDSIGLYNPQRSIFQLRNALTSGQADANFTFGTPRRGWLPIAGAW